MKTILVYLILVYLILCGSMFSQSLNGWVELSGVVNGIAQGMQAHYNIEDRNAYRIGDSQYNEDWHRWQFVNVTTAVGSGIMIGLNNYNESVSWWGAGLDTWVWSGFRWISSSITKNLMQG